MTLLENFADIWLRLLTCFYKVNINLFRTSEKPGNTEDNKAIFNLCSNA